MKILSTGSAAILSAASLLLAFGASAGDDRSHGMDTNGDGMISAAEHESGARDMFDRMDANHDGQVTAAEMDAMHAQMAPGEKGRPEMSSVEKIKTIDTNGDGTISAAEHATGSRSMFAKMDANGDGSLSSEELQAGHDGLMHKDPG